MARKKIVAGNWKMNMTPSQAVKLVEELKPLVVSDDVEVAFGLFIISTSYTRKLLALKELKGSTATC